jgi:hypothetical protein
MKATLHPKKKPSGRHWYAYDVEFDGELLVVDSRDPEHDLARVLLARGLTGNVTVVDGKTGRPRTVVDIERAAPWCVGSNLDRYAYKAPAHGNSSLPAGEEATMVIPTLPDEEAA